MCKFITDTTNNLKYDFHIWKYIQDQNFWPHFALLYFFKVVIAV